MCKAVIERFERYVPASVMASSLSGLKIAIPGFNNEVHRRKSWVGQEA